MQQFFNFSVLKIFLRYYCKVMKVTLTKNTTLQRMKQLNMIELIILKIKTTIYTNFSIYLVFWLFGINCSIFLKLSWSWKFHILAFLGILSVLLKE
jgi:hypothetical protein